MTPYLTPTPGFTWTETKTYNKPVFRPWPTPRPSVRPRPRNHLRRLVLENTRLRAAQVEQAALCTAKDEAMREYVNLRIAQTNAAIRAANGPRPGEPTASYSARLVAANKPRP